MTIPSISGNLSQACVIVEHHRFRPGSVIRAIAPDGRLRPGCAILSRVTDTQLESTVRWNLAIPSIAEGDGLIEEERLL
jgi:hypothetical protein